MSQKKVGVKGMVIRGQGREIVNSVRIFMQEEAKNGLKIPLENYRQRVLEATGISRTAYQRLTKDPRDASAFNSSHKQRPNKNQKIGKDLLKEIGTIRQIVYDLYIIEKRRATVRCIMQKIKETPLSFLTSEATLWRLCKKIGFRWRNTGDNRKMLVESYDIRLKRINFLRKIQQYRSENRNIVYAGETYIYGRFTKAEMFDDGKGSNKKVTKGRRVIIAHAGGENGFLPNTLFIFKSGTKICDFHDEMNHEIFMKWVRTQFLPNLPEQSVLVIDNASYHNVPSQPIITQSTRKIDMINWLRERDIACHEDMTKPELYNIIKEKKNCQDVRYKLDDLLEAHGHKVLRLPPYHSELNPIEKIWSDVKNWVAERNTTCRLPDVEKMTRLKFDDIGVEDWKKNCDHVKKYEVELLEKEHLMDLALDTVQFAVNAGSSDESVGALSEDELDHFSGIDSSDDEP